VSAVVSSGASSTSYSSQWDAKNPSLKLVYILICAGHVARQEIPSILWSKKIHYREFIRFPHRTLSSPHPHILFA